jgi:flagellar biosynthetic protein FlhB
MAFLTWQGLKFCLEQFRFDHALLVQAGRVDLSLASFQPLLDRAIRGTLVLTAPWFAALMGVAVAGHLLHSGPVLSVTPVKPDWDRINPASGLKRMFSLRTLFLGVRALLKIALLGTVVVLALRAMAPRFFPLAGMPPAGMLGALLDGFSSMGLKLALTLGLLALLDLIYTRWQFLKNMRMSRRELKDEFKTKEGDPRIRMRMRELRREWARRVMALRRTREADLLITNPTHIAVALKYEHGQMVSPLVLAKGRGMMAAAMRSIGARYRIPVVQNPTLARALFAGLAVNQHVTPDLYAPVARIIVWLMARRKALGQRQAPRQAGGLGWRRPGAGGRRRAWGS